MKKLIFLVFIAAACSPTKKDNPTETTSADSVATATLTDAQKAEGWKLLFDGQTLSGWKIFKNMPNNTWEAKDGTIHCKPLNEKVKGDGDVRSDLMTTDEYENFELAFDWKISKQGNSGVMFRVTEEFEQPYYSGPEYQVLDDVGFPEKQADVRMTGANYDMHGAATKTMNPPGEWNSAKIVVNGNHVEHWLNGEKIIEYELNSDDWQKRKANSKWKDTAGYGMAKKGHIDLQDHGCEVWYKNLMIKSL
ncbi:MAG: DUF1080 domain-containing protein [Bacteroidetes bacterium]|nr:DUF1080 domain-containing protein [Bacteroidota bacterium]